MHRRKILLAALAPAVSSLIACGGGGEKSEWGEDIPVEPNEPGVSAEALASLPTPIEIPMSYLTEVVADFCDVQVLLGAEKQAKVIVSLFDAQEKLFGTVLTDADGNARFKGNIPRYVRVEANTLSGPLQSYGLVDQSGVENTITVNVFQSLWLRVGDRLQAPLNVTNYAVRDYFSMGEQVLEDFTVDSSVFSQVLLAEDWKASGRSLASYLDELADELVGNIDIDNQTDLRFQRNQTIALATSSSAVVQRVNPDEVLPMDQIKELVGFVIGLVGDAIPVPFASKLFKFFAGMGWKELSKSDKDGFGSIQSSIAEIQSGIREILSAQKQTDVLQHMLKLAARYDDFVEYRNIVRGMREQVESGARTEADFDSRHEDELNILIAKNSGAKLGEAARHFFGCDNYDGLSIVQSIIDLVRLRKFYGQPSQDLYLRYLDYFALQQSAAYLAWAGAMALDAKTKGHTASRISADLALAHTHMKRVNAMIEELRVPKLPERVFIDYANSTAWVGVCNDWESVRDFFSTDTQLREDIYDARTKKTVTGDRGWGINNQKLMAKTLEARTQNGVPLAAIKFGDWTLPTVAQLKASFFDGGKQSKKRIDVYAYEQGVSQGTPFFRPGIKSAIEVVTKQDNKSRYKKNDIWYNTGAVAKVVKFNNYSIDNHAWLMYYFEGSTAYLKNLTHAYFPVASISEAKLNEYLPWRRSSSASCTL